MSQNEPANITWHGTRVTRGARARLKGHGSAVLWFTGLSGAGKSSIANAVDAALNEGGIHTYLLDGDNIRFGLSSNLGFSAADREENIRRVGEVAKLLVDSGLIVLSAFISPYRADRERVRALFGAHEFIEIYCQASLATCEARDPKGLYKQARAGELRSFTGIDAPYEAPQTPELVLDSERHDVMTLTAQVLEYLYARDLVPRRGQ